MFECTPVSSTSSSDLTASSPDTPTTFVAKVLKTPPPPLSPLPLSPLLHRRPSHVPISGAKSDDAPPTPPSTRAASREAQVLNAIPRHANIVPRPVAVTSDAATDAPVLVWHRYECDLFSYVQQAGGAASDGDSGTGLPERCAARLARQILAGLDHLHRVCNLAHGDVKPENVLVRNGDHVVLADFGCAVPLDRLVCHHLGTAAYQAPEQWVEFPRFLPAANDVWAWGVTVMYMLTLCGVRSSAADARHSPRGRGRRGDVVVLPSRFLGLSDDAKVVLSAALRPDPRDRPTPCELLQYPWLRCCDDSDSSAVGVGDDVGVEAAP